MQELNPAPEQTREHVHVSGRPGGLKTCVIGAELIAKILGERPGNAIVFDTLDANEPGGDEPCKQ